jgi:hypothetical protein
MLAHMFNMTRKRLEAERNKKLEDLFRKADDSSQGRIRKEQGGGGIIKASFEKKFMTTSRTKSNESCSVPITSAGLSRVLKIHSGLTQLFGRPFVEPTLSQVYLC